MMHADDLETHLRPGNLAQLLILHRGPVVGEELHLLRIDVVGLILLPDRSPVFRAELVQQAAEVPHLEGCRGLDGLCTGACAINRPLITMHD